jgi:PhoPQ-activated pathogenicity-related protein
MIVNVCSKSLGGWTFSLGSYYGQNITRLLDNPYFQVMSDIVDPYGIRLYLYMKYYLYSLAYFDRYHNTKILQFQAADDQFFPPDSEVGCIKSVA